MEDRKRISPLKVLGVLVAGAAIVAVVLETLERNSVPNHVWKDFLAEHQELHN